MEQLYPSDKNNDSQKQKTQESNVPVVLSPISFFKKDKDFVFIHQKAEKLVSAVYMLTNFLSTEESMKWSLRRLGMDLLKSTIDLKGASSAHKITSERSIQDSVLEMTSLLEVAQFAGLVSEMNVTILKREFHSLLSFIQNMLSKQTISETLFIESSPLPIVEIEPAPTQHQNAAVRFPFSSETSQSADVAIPTQEMSYIKDKTDDSHQKNRGLKEYSPVAVKKNKRQSIIISLLKRKKEIMVKDVSEIIHDCSEKTLQRELLSLVSQGVLAKEGERRWTKYSLAS